MTCIVALVEKGTIHMGADSAGVAGFELRRRADSKVFVLGDFIIGFTSSFRMGQLLRYNFQLPTQKENQDVFAYMVTDFIEAVRVCLKQGGYANVNSNEETGGTFLVGYKKRLFCIDSDFQVGEFLEPYASVGCGESYALGSFYSTEKLQANERLKKALEAAEMFSAGVRGPFNTIQL